MEHLENGAEDETMMLLVYISDVEGGWGSGGTNQLKFPLIPGSELKRQI